MSQGHKWSPFIVAISISSPSGMNIYDPSAPSATYRSETNNFMRMDKASANIYGLPHNHDSLDNISISFNNIIFVLKYLLPLILSTLIN